MKPEFFAEAVEIVSKSNSCTVKFNEPVNDNYSNTYPILILESNGRVIEDLFKAGFSMSMTKKGLAVTKF
jgi:hypothetical protein